MDLLITMSIAGAIPVVLYYLLKCSGKGSFQQYRRLLRTSIFFFLCPIQLLKYKFPGIVPIFFQYTDNKIYLKRSGYEMIRNFDGEYFLKPVWLLIVSFVWVFTVVVVLIFQFLKYKKLKNCLVKTYCSTAEHSINDFTYKREKISYVKSNFIQAPFTIGILKHWIFLPEVELSEDETTMILLHEKAHIKNRDLLFRLICFGICLIHWFNPFAWLLLHEYSVISENICDKQVIQTFETREQRKNYAMLLVKMAARDSKIPYADYFSKEYRRSSKMKKRINYILNGDKKKTGFFTIAWLTACVLSASTVFAYSLPNSWNKELSEIIAENEYIEEGSSEDGLYFSDSELIFL